MPDQVAITLPVEDGTTTIRIGSGIVGCYARPPALTTMGFATLASCAPGRGDPAGGLAPDTGFTGVAYLLPVLSSTGHDAVAYRLLEQETMPSWRYMVQAGATTIWERWDAWTSRDGFQFPWMNSFNHYSLGSVGEWLYRFLLGIDQEPGTAGFGRPLLRPHPGGSRDWARGSYQSARARSAPAGNKTAAGSRTG